MRKVDVGVTFHAGVATLLEGPTNDGEKRVMTELLLEIGKLAPSSSDPSSFAALVADVVVRNTADPLKKKVVVTNENRDPEVDSRGLPDVRLVDACDEQDLLDELGVYLTEVKRLPAGDVPNEQRINVLNDVVAWYYLQLQSVIESLNPNGLIEWLVAHHEALLCEKARSRLVLPTRLACFETRASLCDKWAKEYSELAKAALTTRFVLEYVAARPPAGIRPISASVHDRLTAIASGIINVGFQSDVVHFGLGESKLPFLDRAD